MKKCPKCGAGNRPENAVCYKCNTSLEGVEITTLQATPPPNAGNGGMAFGQPLGAPLGGDVGSDEPVSVVGQPLGVQQPGGAQSQSPYGQTPNPYGQPTRVKFTRRHESATPLKASYVNFGAILYSLTVLAVVLGIGGFVTWKFYLLPNSVVKPVHDFFYGVQYNLPNNVTDTLAQNSKWAVPHAWNYLFLFQTQNMGFDEDHEFKLVFKSVDKDTATVNIIPGPDPGPTFKDETLPPEFKDGYPIILVKEADGWKIDLVQTFGKIKGPAAMAVAEALSKKYAGEAPKKFAPSDVSHPK
jgi:hypothetical protein